MPAPKLKVFKPTKPKAGIKPAKSGFKSPKPMSKPKKPMMLKPMKPKKPSSAGYKSFNKKVTSKFGGGRQLSAEHRTAISKGLQRWHSAHGRGNYSDAHRAKAVKHLNNKFSMAQQHHSEKANFHAGKARSTANKGLRNLSKFHSQRAANHRANAKKYSGLII
jgi:hypothetical protein